MHEVSSYLVDIISRSHPIVPVVICLALIVLLLGFFGLSLWQIWIKREIRRERDQFLRQLHEARTELAQRKEQSESRFARVKSQFSHLRNQSAREIKRLASELGAAQATIDQYRTKLRDASPAYKRIAEHNTALEKQSTDLLTRQGRLQAEVNALLQRFDDLQKIDANVWMAAVEGPKPPCFVERDRRKTRFVTFLNLKGGVGKTTIVANLAAAYATGILGDKKRVLVVDLDYQGTLSNRCVERKTLEDRRSTRRTADRLLDSPLGLTPSEAIGNLLVPMNGAPDTGWAIVADEQLDHVDFRKQALFAIECTEVRFDHRRLLHDPLVCSQFDYVFFDCPPRLTTSSINALTTSDWIVIPTGLDANDVEAVPRTLRWFDKLRTQANIDFHAQLAGILLNSTYRGGTLDELTIYEKTSLQYLHSVIQKFVPMPNSAILNYTVKDDSEIAKAGADSVPFGSSAKGHERYRNTAAELHQRIAN